MHPPEAPLPPAQPYDPELIGTWEYPESATFAIRKYQFDISSTAVRHNTLVSLPTGLGKTLIAAVVMHNFRRWFPTGRAVFVAPTKPLVHQQVHAVRRVLRVPLSEVVELTGSVSKEERYELWRGARLLFMTPQVLLNDLESGTCPGEQIVCLVIDEAHKAVGQAAARQAVDALFRRSGAFRVLGLSATPGQSEQTIQQVLCNLRASRIEARDESSIDVVGWCGRPRPPHPRRSDHRNQIPPIRTPLLPRTRMQPGPSCTRAPTPAAPQLACD